MTHSCQLGRRGRTPPSLGREPPPQPLPEREPISWLSVQIPSPAGTQPAGRAENGTTSPHLGEERISNCEP